MKGINHAVNIFDHTPLENMPSIKGTRSIKKANFSQTVGPAKKKLRKEQEFGIVNYINGVPVSIQINQTPDLLANQYSGDMPTVSWKKSMQKRNKLVNNNDVNKMHYRNEMEKKNF